jgi:DNA adenine methylase
MRGDIFSASNLLRERTIITSKDYREVPKTVSRSDLVYMDPPYQGVCNSRDPRYYTGIDSEEFLHQLELLVNGRISFILSYDG